MLAGVALSPALASFAQAQRYPSGPIRLVVGFAAGNAPDMVARLIGDRLSTLLGEPVVVENRIGGASTIAALAVALAAPDGQTLLQVTPANTINPVLNSGKNFVTDIAPVGIVARGPMVIAVAPSFPVKSMPEFIRYAGEHPDKIIVGSPGTGSTPYLAASLFKMMTGINFLHVPFRGTSQAVTELLGGRVQLVFADMSANELIQSGQLRALAVTAATRHDMMPGVPTVGEFVTGYEASTWYGIGAPKGTPAGIIERLNALINQSLTDVAVKDRLARFGFAPETGSPESFGKLIVAETTKWAKVSKFAQAG
jgi:tripartite-type tricarboxylate transporter receptor subunit TctC